MDFICDTLIRSVIVYVMIYAWQIVKQIVKSWFIGEINPTIIDVVLSVIVGWLLSSFILNKMK